MLQKMEILNFPPLSVELEMSTTAECNPPFVVVPIILVLIWSKIHFRLVNIHVGPKYIGI